MGRIGQKEKTNGRKKWVMEGYRKVKTMEGMEGGKRSKEWKAEKEEKK